MPWSPRRAALSGKAVGPGAFSAALAIDEGRLITRERTEHHVAVLVLHLRLESGGAAALDVAVRGKIGRSQSRFDPRGAAHSEQVLDDHWRFTGTWHSEDRWARIQLDRPPNPNGTRLELRCGRAHLGDLALLSCELTGGGLDLPALEDRNGPSRFWLLGLEPALLRAEQGFHDPEPRISARGADRPVGDSDLDGKWSVERGR